MLSNNGSEYDEVDYRICGELGKYSLSLISIEEKNRALDEFVLNQSLDGVI
jgi:hypothetical protein